MRLKKSKDGKSGFTLVELLVVVSIISLLISILLPALSQAKELANMTVCRTNLKTLSTAFAMYTAENNDWYPGAAGWGGDPPIWDERTYPYWENYDVLKCPSDNFNRVPYYSWVYRLSDVPDKPRSYAMNINVSYRGPSKYGDDYSPPYAGEVPYTKHGSVYKTTDIEKPEDTILLGEEWISYYYGPGPRPGIYDDYCGHGIYDGMWSSSVPKDPPSRSPTFYHRDKEWCNFVFCDGHAVPLRKDNPNIIDDNGNSRNDPGELYY